MSYLISVLDKSPVAEGASPEQALRNSLQLAQRAEQLGYHRYWFAEHHAAPALASPAPEVLAAWVLA
ncbi:alkane 1-monooxygenase, partial [Stenotrophomonas maltophilia]